MKYNISAKSLPVKNLQSEDSKCKYYLNLPSREEEGVTKIMVKRLYMAILIAHSLMRNAVEF